MIRSKQKSDKVFYGWWIVLASGVGLALHYGPVIVTTFGVFLKPLGQSFGWSRTQISLAFSLSTLGITVTLPLIGYLVDRFGARRVIVLASLLFGIGVISLSFLSAHLWHFYAVYILIGVAGSGTTPVAYAKIISYWFDRRRGLALGIGVAAIGLSGSLMPTFAQALIVWVGWRQAYLLLGLVAAGITVPVIWLLIKEMPQTMGFEPDGAFVGQPEVSKPRVSVGVLSVREIWHTGTFWLLVSAVFLISVSFHGYMVHLVPLLTDRGFSAQTAALIVLVAGVTAVIGRIGVGYLLDRFFAPFVAMIFFGAFALGMFILYSGTTGGLVFVAVFLVGLGLGAELDFIPFAISRYFGLHAFGKIYSHTFSVFNLGGVIGPLMMGMVFDATGSYRQALAAFTVASLTAAGLITRLGPYTAGAQTWGRRS